ncbi:MAG: glycosyltransferase family 39 protein [Streptosporangiaceae bacterium]
MASRPVPARMFPDWLVVVVPVLAELVVGGYRLAGPSLWRDEAATISGAARPAGAILALTRNQDAVHGPYYLLLHPVILADGISATVIRLPSLIAMCLAVGLTVVLGRRLARISGLPAPSAVGLLAGLLLVSVPLTTRYAQEARPYALTSLCAVLASYLLVRAASSGRWPWWAGYAAAMVLTGAFNLFAVLLAIAHGVSLLLARRPAAVPARAGAGPDGTPPAGQDAVLRPAAGSLARWLISCVVAAVLLGPLAYYSLRQAGQLNWVTTPTPSTVATLARDFAGATLAIPVIVVLGWLGLLAGRGLHRGAGLSLAVVALPWLVLPPVVLIAASFAHPVYVERYVVFCLPALSLLAAAGLVWLVVLAGRAACGRGLTGRPAALASVAPSALLALVLLAAVAGPQVQIRAATARADNLRAVSAVVAAHERPGDAVVYLPWDTAVVGMAYSAPFRRLANIGLAQSPVASATLRGLPVPAGVLIARLRTVRRVWTVQWSHPLPGGGLTPAAAAEARAIGGMRLVGRWRISSVILSLYAARR